MKTLMNVCDVVQRLVGPGARVTESVTVLAYGGSARDRRRAMRADKRAIAEAVRMHGFGTANANGGHADIQVQGHVVASHRELLQAGRR